MQLFKIINGRRYCYNVPGIQQNAVIWYALLTDTFLLCRAFGSPVSRIANCRPGLPNGTKCISLCHCGFRSGRGNSSEILPPLLPRRFFYCAMAFVAALLIFLFFFFFDDGHPVHEERIMFALWKRNLITRRKLERPSTMRIHPSWNILLTGHCVRVERCQENLKLRYKWNLFYNLQTD